MLDVHAIAKRVDGEVGSVLARIFLRQVDRLGRSVRTVGQPYVENFGRIEIGDNVRMSSRPVQSHLVTGRHGRIFVGNDVTISEGAAIAAESTIIIGDGAYLGPFSMVMDTDFHDTKDHDARSRTAPVRIGAGVRLERDVTVLKGADIGDHARIAAGSVVAGTVPSGALARGVPARVVGLQHQERRVEEAVDDLVRRVIMETFALSDPPEPGHGPSDIEAWDSFGTLRLVMALEHELQITIPEAVVQDMTTVNAVIRIAAMPNARRV